MLHPAGGPRSPRFSGTGNRLWLLAGTDHGIGTSVHVFETKKYAEKAAEYPVPPMPGVTQLDLTVREVFAHARCIEWVSQALRSQVRTRRADANMVACLTLMSRFGR